MAFAQQTPPQYTVELVIFRTASQAGALPIEAAPPAAGDDDVETTASTSRRLGGAASKLRTAAGYRVLAHTAWNQNAVGCVNDGCRSFNHAVSAEQLGLTKAGITGKIILKRGLKLNLGIDLAVDDGGRRYHLTEVRSLKPNEAQYFDHPAIGVLAIVSSGS